MKKPLYYIDIAILTRTSLLSNPVYTYTSDKDHAFGDLAEVPFGKRILWGVVVASSLKKPPIRRAYRPIRRILRQNILTKEQYQLSQYLAYDYVAPAGSVLNHFIFPREPKQDTLQKESILPPKKKKQTFASTSLLARKIARNTKNLLLSYPAGKERWRLLIEIARIRNGDEGQSLILLPDRASLESIQTFFPDDFSEENFVILHGSLRTSQKYEIWKKIQTTKQPLIIFGTKSALFAPFKNLTSVILDDEHRASHKQDQASPRYDSRRTIEQLAHIFGAWILFTSATPSIEYIHYAKKQKWTSFLYPRKNLSLEKNIHVISTYSSSSSTKQAFPTKEKLFSPELIHTIKTTLEKKEIFFLLTARRGMNALSICLDCKQLLTCPQCHRALLAQKNGTYRCGQCHFHSDIFMKCPHCLSMRFSHRIPGTQSIEKKAQELFPFARIMRIDSDSEFFIAKRFNPEAIEMKKSPDIIIGTPGVLQQWPLSRPGGVGIIEAQTFWQWPEYLAEERAFQIFSRLLDLLKRSDSPGIIQTRDRDHRVIQALFSRKKTLNLYKEIEEERKDLSYPPFARMISLTGKHTSEKILSRQSGVIRESLVSAFPDYRISPPFTPLQKKNTSDSFQKILIRIPQKNYALLDPDIRKHLGTFSPNWSVDVDPRETA